MMYEKLRLRAGKAFDARCLGVEEQKNMWLYLDTLVIPELKAVYFGTPGNAHNSLKCVIQNGRKVRAEPVTDVGNKETMMQMLTDLSWNRFMFSKNPYLRIFSIYKKVVFRWTPGKLDKGSNIRILINKIQKYRIIPEDEVVGFEDFIFWMEDNPDEWMWSMKPQSELFNTDIISYSFIGKLEDMNKDMDQLMVRLGTGIVNVPIHNRTCRVPLKWVYNQNMADLVYGMYRDDFDGFGYERESWKTL